MAKPTRLSRRDFLRLSGAAAFGTMVAPYNLQALSIGDALHRLPLSQAGGAVVTAIGTEPIGMDPCNPWGLGSAMWGLISLCYDPWWAFDRDQQIQPVLAESWSRVDETTIVYQIRQGVKYHGSGRELTAEDVVWNYERITNEELACSGLTVYQQHVESITALDTYTFQVKLLTPNLLFTRIPLPYAFDPTALENTDEPLMLQAEAGTGPWMLNEWKTENYIAFKRNPDYWGQPPQFEEFRFQVIPEERATVAAMRAGQLNFLPISKIENFLQLQEEPEINTWAGPGLEYRRLNVNHFREALQNPDVLQALRFGLNRQQFVDTLTQGYGKVSGPLSPAVTRYALPEDELAELQAYDPERARSLLRNAGYDETDNRLRLVLLSIAGFKNFNDVAQIAQANLRDIGIDVEIRIQEVGVWVDARITSKDYDLSVNDYAMGFDPDFTWYRSGQAEQDFTAGEDPKLDELIDAANVEQDEEKRVGLIRDTQRLLIENVRELYLYAPPVFEAASKKLVGYTPWPGSTNLRVFDWDQVTIEG